MFDPQQRDRLRDRVLELAKADERVVAGAIVGSLAQDEGDRWSDLDLTFGVAEGVSVSDLLEEWTGLLAAEFEAVHLFDLPVGPIVYRVLLMPDGLQLDVSLAPVDDMRATSPRIRQLWGKEPEEAPPPPPSAKALAGWAVLHARTVRVCIERGKWWMAEYFIAALRQHSLALACLRLGLPTSYGKGFDLLPPTILDAHEETLVRSLDRDDLLTALTRTIEVLGRELQQHSDVDPKLHERLLDYS